MIVYSLLSHDCRMLPMQVAAIRHFLPETSRIKVIEGPHGADGITSAGALKLADAAAHKLGIEAIEAPAGIAGLPLLERVRALFAVALRDRAGESAIIMHGDLFPITTLRGADILNGNAVAGRVHSPGQLAWTWLWVGEGCELSTDNITSYGSSREASDLGFEICEPGFLHADKIATSHWPGAWAGRFYRKVEEVRGRLAGVGVTADECDPCERLTDLPRHRARFRKSAGLGDTIAKLTHTTGIDRLVKAILGADCGCEERRQKLNAAVPYSV